jgi:ankyrin repeat protein
MAHLLLSHGADPNRLSDKTYRQSGLGTFVSKQSLQSNHRLLHSGMSCINCPAPCREQIALRGAAEDGERKILEYICEQGAAMLSQPESIEAASVLRGFVRSGFHKYVLEELRSREVKFCDDFGKRSPVNAAILRGDSMLLGQLLAGGANVHEYAGNRYSNSHGYFGASTTETLSPIQCAARMNCLGMARMLCIAGANINQSPYDQSGDMALHLAIRHSNYDVTKFLVEQNVGLGTYSKGETALFLAIKGGCNSILGLLLENGADPNQPCYNDGLSWMRRRLIPLDNACFDGTLDMVRALLHAGADTSQGYAVPSLFNSYRDHSNTDEILEILLQYGADVNNRCRSESTPLQRTILEERFHYTDLLIKAGAYINAPASNGERGRTALQAAVEVGNVDMVRRLILDNADVNAPAAPDQGVTALQAAAIQGYLNIAKILLEHGAVIDAAASPKNGCKAINGAAEFGRIDMVKLLLDNYHGPTPVSELCDDARTAAKKENQWYVIELLDTYEHPDEVST